MNPNLFSVWKATMMGSIQIKLIFINSCRHSPQEGGEKRKFFSHDMPYHWESNLSRINFSPCLDWIYGILGLIRRDSAPIAIEKSVSREDEDGTGEAKQR